MKTVGCLIFALVGLAAAEPIFFELFNKAVQEQEQQPYADPSLTYGPPELTNPGPQYPTWQFPDKEYVHKPFSIYKPTFEIKPFTIPIPKPQFVPYYKPIPYYKPQYVPVQYPGYHIQKPDFEAFKFGIKTDITDKVTGIKTDISDKVTGFKQEVTGFKQGVSDKVTGFKQGISDKVTGFKQEVTGFKQGISDSVTGFKQDISDSVTGFKQDISDRVTGFKQGISDKVTDKVTGVKNAAIGLKSHINDEINKKITGIKHFGDGIKEIGAAVGSAFHGLKQDFINKHGSKPQYVLVPAHPHYPQGPYVPHPGPQAPSLTYGPPEFQ